MVAMPTCKDVDSVKIQQKDKSIKPKLTTAFII